MSSPHDTTSSENTLARMYGPIPKIPRPRHIMSFEEWQTMYRDDLNEMLQQLNVMMINLEKSGIMFRCDMVDISNRFVWHAYKTSYNTWKTFPH